MGPPRTKARAYLRRVTKVLAGLLLAGWLGRSVYLRLTLDPPGYEWNKPTLSEETTLPSSAPARAMRAATDYLEDQPRTYVLPEAPTNMGWRTPQCGNRFPTAMNSPGTEALELDDALLGPWTPAVRPNLRAAIAFIEEADTRIQIARLLETARESWQLPDNPGNDITAYVRAAIVLLAVDARYQLEERHDPGAAWEDLRAGLDLVAPLARGALHHRAVRTHFGGLVLDALRRDAATLPTELFAEIDRTLQAVPHNGDAWERCMDAEAASLADYLDTRFTRRPNGNGWYVVTVEHPPNPYSTAFITSFAAKRRSRLWDLSSYLYNDRRTVETKFAWFVTSARMLDDQPFPAARKAFLDKLADAPAFSLLDGPEFTFGQFHDYLQDYQYCMTFDARLNATRLALAVERYRRAQHTLPATADELVPDYLAAVPTDPFANQPLQYRREPQDRYLIWSWGGNAANDNGVEVQDFGWVEGDLAFKPERPPPEHEPTLVPRSGTGASGSQPTFHWGGVTAND